jgi:hypothetical protein
MKPKLEEVFGVSSQPVLSYVEREDVDNHFVNALKSDKQIVIYGSSKQGKTALVSKHISYKDNISISLSPKHSLSDIYSSILRQANIKIEIEKVDTSSKEFKIGVVAKFKALIPIFGGIETEGNSDSSASSGTEIKYEPIPFNLELSQDIAEILKKINFKHFIILENFHYLNDELQLQFAYDLRTFQELGIRFIILGVW